jgi:hypothetical protein
MLRGTSRALSRALYALADPLVLRRRPNQYLRLWRRLRVPPILPALPCPSLGAPSTSRRRVPPVARTPRRLWRRTVPRPRRPTAVLLRLPLHHPLQRRSSYSTTSACPTLPAKRPANVPRGICILKVVRLQWRLSNLSRSLLRYVFQLFILSSYSLRSFPNTAETTRLVLPARLPSRMPGPFHLLGSAPCPKLVSCLCSFQKHRAEFF